MDRRLFLKLSGTGLIGMAASTKYFTGKRMPTLFIGHGSPMNSIADNAFSKNLKALGESLPLPKKIILVSAHWSTSGVEVHAASGPKMIYDFYGFPEALYKINYPAPGDEELASKIKVNLQQYQAKLDYEWGFDHGAWSVLHHLYPFANIPVVQLSLNENFMSLNDHLKLASELKKLREEGVLIIGSGNIVHNLRSIKRDTDAPAVSWAQEFDELIKQSIKNSDFTQLLAEDSTKHTLWKMAHPTLEHYLPLLYVLGATDVGENVTFPYEAFEHGSLSMRSVLIGA